ncbi:hypothetical protein [Nesterenkonia marinintestina]|uniref:hypothetical protein n=1 Tax=Nesterenkonia marinintestina TaxID=2979865 RepID=UPI0021BFD1A5|nr:hypothetical protein [Nesterenkonia sp. GX14115]
MGTASECCVAPAGRYAPPCLRNETPTLQTVRLSHCDATKLHQIRGAVEAASKIKQKYRHVAYTPIKPTLPQKKQRGRRPRSFTPDETKSLIADYQAGVSVRAISEKFGCSRSIIQRILQVNDIPRRTPDLTAEQVEALRKRRAEGATYAQLVKEFRVSKRTISKYTASSATTGQER